MCQTCFAVLAVDATRGLAQKAEPADRAKTAVRVGVEESLEVVDDAVAFSKELSTRPVRP